MWIIGTVSVASEGRILCFKFSLNPHKFSLTRETDTDPRAEQFENFNFQVKKPQKHQFRQTTKCQMAILI